MKAVIAYAWLSVMFLLFVSFGAVTALCSELLNSIDTSVEKHNV